MQWTETTRAGYAKLWSEMVINKDHRATADTIARAIVSHQSDYAIVQEKTGVPWWWIGITHQLESGGNFRTHLHNGDALTDRTHNVPKGRPATGNPPFTWEESAIDALCLKGLQNEHDWSIPKALYNFERYNGFGYVAHKINSPYLWSFSNHYKCGKYVADGDWDARAVSQQCGAAVILKTLVIQGILDVKHIADAVADAKVNANKTKENLMKDLEEFMPLISAVAPTVVTLLAGPLAGIAAKAVADELGAKDTSTSGVASAMKATPVTAIVEALKAADKALSPLLTNTPAEPVAAPVATTAPAGKAPEPSPNGVLVDPTATVTKTLVASILFVLASLFIKDATLAHSLADAFAPIIEAALTGIGGSAITWLLHRSVTNANANTVASLK